MPGPLPKIKYTYFDVPAARGEQCRLAMVIANIPFEDNRVDRKSFGSGLKSQVPLGSLPVIEIDGQHTSTQSLAILRYIGKLGGLYSDHPLQALYIDEVLGTVMDFFQGVVKLLFTDDSLEKKQQIVEDVAHRYWGGLQSIVQKHSPNSTYILDDHHVSIADIAIAAMYNLLVFGKLHFIPADALDKFERLKAIHTKVMQIPQVIQHYQQHPIVPLTKKT